jgi:hypothetical protein
MMVLGGVLPFEDLLAAVPGPDEHGSGWDDFESSRFGWLARRLWDPVLGHEQMQDR